jgi:hypothetical protein
MPPFPSGGYPTDGHVVAYLAAYEQRYELPVHREPHGLRVDTNTGVCGLGWAGVRTSEPTSQK